MKKQYYNRWILLELECNSWLVGGFKPLWKIWVNWDYEIPNNPNIWKTEKQSSKPPTSWDWYIMRVVNSQQLGMPLCSLRLRWSCFGWRMWIIDHFFRDAHHNFTIWCVYNCTYIYIYVCVYTSLNKQNYKRPCVYLHRLIITTTFSFRYVFRFGHVYLGKFQKIYEQHQITQFEQWQKMTVVVIYQQ